MDKSSISKHLEDKLGISCLNEMQNAVVAKWHEGNKNIILYSPTGTGKTLAFVLPILHGIDVSCFNTEALIIEPTRELVLQVTDVLKKLAPSIKTTPCYGGHNSHDERMSLAANPSIVVSTPGRLLDHLERGNLCIKEVTMLILDEFDKSLELGFIDDMRQIIERLPSTVRIMMTSATEIKSMPKFLHNFQFETANFLQQDDLSPQSRITIWQVRCNDGNRLKCLKKLLFSISDEKTIVFANQRDTAQLIYRQLIKDGLMVGLFVGTLEQNEREKVLSMFKNGSLMVVVSTDLGGRGIDISDIRHIIHYEPPLTNEIFTHRNGRTARVDATGEVYVITYPEEALAPFITIDGQYQLDSVPAPMMKIPTRATIHISAGKKEKVSRGDVVGYLLHNCPMLSAHEIAGIDIFDHYTLVGVPREYAEDIVKTISPFKLKKQKVKSRIVGFRPKFVK